MEKYFAKHLPVEGGILPNEDFVHKLMPGVLHTNKDLTPINHQDYQKVKLFLCSRDIQVGDRFRFQGTVANLSQEYLAISNDEESDDYKINIGVTGRYDFKVIGEISPDAKWVKEGMEFNEEEVCGIYPQSYEDDTLVPINEFEKYVTEMNSMRKKGYEYNVAEMQYAIKGPCGHFH